MRQSPPLITKYPLLTGYTVVDLSDFSREMGEMEGLGRMLDTRYPDWGVGGDFGGVGSMWA
jgi:hypothetical protein